MVVINILIIITVSAITTVCLTGADVARPEKVRRDVDPCWRGKGAVVIFTNFSLLFSIQKFTFTGARRATQIDILESRL